MQEKVLFADAFMNQPSIIKRLGIEFTEASREFREDPKAYIKTAFKGDGIGGHRRKMLLRFGLAMGIVVYAIFFGAILILWSIHAKAKETPTEELEVRMINPDDFKMQQVEAPKADKRAGGGGGGGRNTPTPPSKGQLSKFSLMPPIIAPTTRPQLKTPPLVVPETVMVDPKLEPPRKDDIPTGLPTGVPGPPSDGPGSGNGIGTGKGGGVGQGNGMGVGPGNGYNMGGGDPSLGGGTGARGPATAVDQQPIPLNSPQPRYTEEARKNKIQGTVLARVLIGADGAIKQVRITRSLPDGLDEMAIQAAYQLRFKPAMKGGQPVAMWKAVAIEFNLR
ncbi:MAG TPA: TonB family protein [Blastocatellia bacterium]|jgi:TonB family protein|nr:TonB family protein [Blastocatellia bacterium]